MMYVVKNFEFCGFDDLEESIGLSKEELEKEYKIELEDLGNYFMSGYMNIRGEKENILEFLVEVFNLNNYDSLNEFDYLGNESLVNLYK